MNINLLNLNIKFHVGRKVSNVNFPLNPEVDEWMRLYSDTKRTCHRIWEREDTRGAEREILNKEIQPEPPSSSFAFVRLLSASLS